MANAMLDARQEGDPPVLSTTGRGWSQRLARSVVTGAEHSTATDGVRTRCGGGSLTRH
jgi:hypothetical protein